jgi:hypothetical protein
VRLLIHVKNKVDSSFETFTRGFMFEFHPFTMPRPRLHLKAFVKAHFLSPFRAAVRSFLDILSVSIGV